MSDPNIPRVKRGRPPALENFNRKEYNKKYYELNKEKTKGLYLCDVCNVYCSISNKSRHKKNPIHTSKLHKETSTNVLDHSN